MKTLKEYLSTVEGRKQMTNELNGILDEFDFSAVAAAMDALDWAWHLPEELVEEYLEKGRRVFYDPDYPDLATYRPEYEDIMRTGRRMLFETLEHAAEQDGYYYYSKSGGFEVEVEVVEDETRERAFGEDAPDDFEHSVDVSLKFVVEGTITKF